MDGRRVPVLGLDVGSTNVKAVLVLLDPEAARDARPVPVAVRSAPTPERAEALVAVVLGLVRAVLEGRPAPHAVGIASMAETGVPLGADGEPLTDLLRWDGRRGGDDAALVAADLGAAELFAATGVRTSAKVPLVTWHWLRRTQPRLWRRVARWAGAADVVAHALTGRLVTDHTLAGRTMAYRLPAPGDPLPRAFDADLLATVGWTPDRLPEVVLPGDAPAAVADPRFVAAGLRAGTPVVVAGHDHAVGTWAAGARHPGDRADSLGTAEAVLTVLGGPVHRPDVARQGMSLVRTVAGVHEAVLAGSPAAGAMARWWSDAVLGGRALAEVLPPDPPAEPTGVLVLPYPSGRQSPWPDPSARVRVLDERDRDITPEVLAGAPDDARAGRHTVAMLEGLALQARWMLDVQAGLGGRAAARGASAPHAAPAAPGALAALAPGDGERSSGVTGPVRVLAGAAAANRVWMGLKAATTAGPVDLVQAAEPVATGAALLAAERVGLVPMGALRLPARVVERPGTRTDHAGVLARFVAAATRAPANGPSAPAGVEDARAPGAGDR